jgi:hypothetical protein
MAATALLRLAALTGEHEYERAAAAHLQLLHELIPRAPLGLSQLLIALDLHLSATREVALVGEDIGPLLAVVRARLRPHLVVAAGSGADAGGVPLLEGRTPVDGQAAAYVCEGFACRRPVTDPTELEQLLA